MRLSVLVGLLAVSLLALGIPGPAGAQVAGDPRLVLDAQAPTVTLGGDLTYTVQVANAPADTTIRTTVFEIGRAHV